MEVWSDIQHEIKLDAQGTIKRAVDIEAVKSSIYNILGTRKGERVMLPQFASRFEGFIFENIKPELMYALSKEIAEVVLRWDDRVLVTAVDYDTDTDRNEVSLMVEFQIRGYDQVFSIGYTLGGI